MIDTVTTVVTDFLNEAFAKRGSKNVMTVSAGASIAPWVGDYTHPSYRAAETATQEIWKQTPNYTREGGSIGPAITFDQELKANLLLLPMGRGDDGAQCVMCFLFRRGRALTLRRYATQFDE